MFYHLQKAKEIFSEEDLITAAKSILRYIPVEINNIIFRLRYGKGIQVMDEDWDNLLILDACRYDMFSNQVGLAGKLDSRISLGSSSEEFLEKNFVGNKFHDTVYVNSNPYLPKLDLDEENFHAVINCLSDYDSKSQTVLPETVADAAIKANQQYPNKRLIIHFMQPHTPFLGEVGRTMAGGSINEDGQLNDSDGIWSQLRNNETETNISTVWEAYNENLELVLDSVTQLLKNINGKTVITADHGNMVGERLKPIPSKKSTAIRTEYILQS
ncbi:hypothetical protein [Halonotius sp. GCM10025705]|uniref:hypothetical protein n=1 Tax=Halonotius sp. GCM10025705 TaxID=3252678 RepID=UPI0036190F28